MAAFLLFLLLLQSPPFIVASSDDTATPTTEVSPTLAAVLIVFVAVFFFSGIVFVALRKIIDSGWCGFSAGNRVGGTRPPPPSDGLTKEAVQTLPIYFYKDVKMHRQVGKGEIECAVCLNEFQDTQVLRVLPKCSHVFHPDCVEPWLLSQATCPVCRTIVQNSEASDNHVITIDQYSPDVTLTKSHSTGHSPLWTGDRDHRFTLRLPQEAAVLPSQFRSPRIGYRSNILCWGLNRDYKPDRSASNHTPSLPHQDYPLSDTAHS